MRLQKSDPHSIELCAAALVRGEVVIIPTDTVYGFSGIVPESEERIRRIKGRDETKPFIQLIAEPEDIALYSDSSLPPVIRSLMPGAVTVIVKNIIKNAESSFIPAEDSVSGLADNASCGTTTAFRCPDDDWLRTLIRKCGKPLYSTSVNRSGFPVLTDIDTMEKEFAAEVFCIVDGGEKKEALPSTIVDLSGGTPKIVRQGSVKIDL
ncbi:MAG: L-threonylcarbamoyladenylate synthase [Treponema sp.]|uniref:L-threonylcarbamoyladenylate synthase n=1 Tax=Treponema sp. TaxID=166 RepID=UPI003FA2078F